MKIDSTANPYLAHLEPKESDNPNPYLKYQRPSIPFSNAREPKISLNTKPKTISNSKILKLSSKKSNNLFGNYHSYYGYRKQLNDKRFEAFKKEWFENKTVLDIGCNSGHITVQLAQFNTSCIDGVDIDPILISKARHHLSIQRSIYATNSKTQYFPISCPYQFGPLPVIYQNEENLCTNVELDNPTEVFSKIKFRCGDWLHEPLPLHDSELYDVVMALSITKWIHLNNGDGGLRHFFNKVYKSLRKGGLFILEPQSLDGYEKRSKLSQHMLDNYQAIEFFPDMFVNFLTKKVGFTLVESFDITDKESKLFTRPLHVFQK
ncbi:Bicoid-interacting protein 3-domain-containing protein [Globomyces pollinis-pini]|nr:Bicoid-interacting protein 3-domain-containing protein [Globomyces pollinis-pini]KAJ2999249.1 hypothetical protein HDV02_003343 [Globomyces sp. JEL0801]